MPILIGAEETVVEKPVKPQILCPKFVDGNELEFGNYVFVAVSVKSVVPGKKLDKVGFTKVLTMKLSIETP